MASPKGEAGQDETKSRLAFVLLEKAEVPDPRQVIQAFSIYAGPGEVIREAASDQEGQESEMLSFQGPGDSTLMAFLMPMAIPNREAEEHVRHSLSSFQNGWTLPGYQAHLVVTMLVGTGSPASTLATFTAFIAALLASTPAVGVYWGNAGATHLSKFFLDVAGDRSATPPVLLWTGFSAARQEDGRMSLLSLGMGQLGLPDILLTPKHLSPGDGIMALYDLLAYCVTLGSPIPEGHTIGRTAEERLPVRYVPSPRNPGLQVIHIDGM